MPSVSIVLPTFNRAAFLEPAVASVFAQTFRDWELIVADDGSGEDTRAWLRSIESPSVRILWLEHCGIPARVRNRGIAVARGRFVAFLDSDDLWSPVKLERQVATMCSTGSRWSFSGCDRIDASGRPLASPAEVGVLRTREYFASLLDLSLTVAMPAVVAERSLLEELGGFDETQRYGEFHDLCLRMALRAEPAVVPGALCSVRAHLEHYSADRLAAHADWVRLYEKMARLAPSSALRESSLHMRARMALQLANGQGARGELRAAWRTLRDSGVFAPARARLWPRAALALLRPALGARGAQRRSGARP